MAAAQEFPVSQGWLLLVLLVVLAGTALNTGLTLLPRQRYRAVPWSWPHLLGAFLISAILPGMAVTWFRALLPEWDPLVSGMWAVLFAFPFQVLAILGFLRAASGALPYQMGLSADRLGQNLVLGFLFLLGLLPIVFMTNALVDWIFRTILNEQPESHPLMKLARDGEWFILVVTATVVAPVTEELLFRGLVQPWAERARGGDGVMLVAFLMALVQRAAPLLKGEEAGDYQQVLQELEPALFVLLMVPGYLAVRRLRSWGAIWASSLLFAAAHSNVWPSPIALFILALGLGYLAYRTQSLVGPIVVHSLFNGTMCLLLGLGIQDDGGGSRVRGETKLTGTAIGKITGMFSSFLP